MDIFSTDALNLTSDSQDLSFVVNIASPNPLNKDLSVTIAIDDSKRIDYNNSGAGLQYDVFPDSCYTLTNTSATIAAGSRQATFTITFYKSKIDLSKNYMLPITITDASGENISANMDTHYFHAIGNPLAGTYNWDFLRWPNQDGSGDPDIYFTDVNTFLPVTPTQFEVTSGYYTGTIRYEVTFDNSNGVLSNFAVAFNSDSQQLVKACNEKNWEQVYFIAHKMKANIELLGIDSIKGEIRTVERNAKAKNHLDQLADKINRIHTTIQSVAEEMKKDFHQ